MMNSMTKDNLNHMSNKFQYQLDVILAVERTCETPVYFHAVIKICNLHARCITKQERKKTCVKHILWNILQNFLKSSTKLRYLGKKRRKGY